MWGSNPSTWLVSNTSSALGSLGVSSALFFWPPSSLVDPRTFHFFAFLLEFLYLILSCLILSYHHQAALMVQKNITEMASIDEAQRLVTLSTTKEKVPVVYVTAHT